MGAPPRGHFGTLDQICAGLRLVALFAGVLLSVQVAAGLVLNGVLTALAVFAGYSVVLYLLGWRLLHSRHKSTFYGTAAVLDFALIGVLLVMTGGGQSPFFYAYYPWIAILGVAFGVSGAVVGSTAVLSIVAITHALGFPRTAGVLSLELGTMIAQGLLVGFLADQGRQLASRLRSTEQENVETNEQLAAEQGKLLQEQKLSSLGMLTASVAHEVNNPLSGLIGCVRALEEGRVPPEREAEYYETLLDGLGRMRVTLASLLDYSRRRPRVALDVDVAELVKSALRLVTPMLREKDLIIDEQLVPTGSVYVLADRTELLQALVNVLLNALYVVPNRGHIAVSVRPLADQVEIRVEDRGPGIPSEILGRITEPFFTTKPAGEGTGLGLALTLKTLRGYGGDLAIDSEEGVGTVVTMTLPVPAVKQQDRPADEEAPHSRARSVNEHA